MFHIFFLCLFLSIFRLLRHIVVVLNSNSCIFISSLIYLANNFQRFFKNLFVTDARLLFFAIIFFLLIILSRTLSILDTTDHSSNHFVPCLTIFTEFSSDFHTSIWSFLDLNIQIEKELLLNQLLLLFVDKVSIRL